MTKRYYKDSKFSHNAFSNTIRIFKHFTSFRFRLKARDLITPIYALLSISNECNPSTALSTEYAISSDFSASEVLSFKYPARSRITWRSNKVCWSQYRLVHWRDLPNASKYKAHGGWLDLGKNKAYNAYMKAEHYHLVPFVSLQGKTSFPIS